MIRAGDKMADGSSIPSPDRFFSLHSHSNFSVFDGLGLPQEHIDFCVENGLDGWSMTDHGNMNGFGHAWTHVDKMRKSGKGFKLVPGCEMYIHPDLQAWQTEYDEWQQLKRDRKSHAKAKEKPESVVTPIVSVSDSNDETIGIDTDSSALVIENEDETKSTKYFNPINRRHHLVVLPRHSKGLEKLFGLISRSYSEGFYKFPRVDLRMLKEAQEDGNFVASTACLTGDSEVVTDQGLQRLDLLIERVKSGEEAKILSYNEKSKCKEFKRVTWGDVTRKNAKLLRIKTKDGKSITLTPDHKVFTNHGWVEASMLSKIEGIKILSV
jgi:DNA polymerase III alpha subunit